MKERPSHPQEPFLHPRILEMDRTRTVIKVNFAAHRAERELCDKHHARNLYEVVHASDEGAMEFLSTVERYKANDPEYVSQPIVAAILAGRERFEFFMKNPHRFRRVMVKSQFEDALCSLVKNDVASACYFLGHPEKFKWVGGYKRAKALADESIRRSADQSPQKSEER
ncbi:hypothetical protein HZA44_01660 [Candidatus Peregrinibacteria bacterium]|nr:hypothetical protein [Candidatus Peregrinibacteria bacterium]